MKFHLEFPIPSFKEKINYRHKLLFMGSCFAENIGEILAKHKFNIILNPNGILYNPASIATALRRIINKELLKPEELFYANECWNSWEYHSEFSWIEKDKTLDLINSEIGEANEHLGVADWLSITFGSAYYYKHIKDNKLVANCHKVPQKEFTKHLLTSAEIIDDYTVLINELKQFNPKLKIVFTISPVRYIRDGVVENNLSKAQLINAVHELVKQNEHVYYFPAYELVIDDLRDYRFYNEDLVHPSEQAIDYVFEKWKETTFDEETKVLFEKIKDIKLAMNHHPFNPVSDARKKFKAAYQDKSMQLQKEYTFLDFEEEIAFFKYNYSN